MKNLSILIAVGFLAMACQNDSLTVNNMAHNNLLNDPSLAGKLLQLTQYPTTFDNIADGTSCFSLHLPATVVANGQTLILNTTADYQQIHDIVDASNTDTDSVVLQFPVSVTNADYSESTFQDQSQFDLALQNCTPSVELSCISLVFPIKVAAYDNQDGEWEYYTFQNKGSFFQCMNQLDTYDVISIVYPLTLVSPDGSNITIQNNDQLESTINAFTPECLATNRS